MALAIAQNQVNRVNQLGNFKELSIGSGARILKANMEGVFLGGTNYSTSPLKFNYSGSILSGSSAGLQVEQDGVNGKINFYYNGSRVGYLVGISTGDMALDADKDLYFSANSAQVLMLVGATAGSVAKGDAWMRTSGSKIYWTSGRYLKDGGSQITCDGKFVATTSGGDADIEAQRDIIGGRDVRCNSTGNFYRGSDVGVTESHAGVTDFDIEIKGGIITSFTDNS